MSIAEPRLLKELEIMTAIFEFAEWLSILKQISTSMPLYIIHHSWKVEPQMYSSMEATRAEPIELWSVEEARRAGKTHLWHASRPAEVQPQAQKRALLTKESESSERLQLPELGSSIVCRTGCFLLKARSHVFLWRRTRRARCSDFSAGVGSSNALRFLPMRCTVFWVASSKLTSAAKAQQADMQADMQANMKPTNMQADMQANMQADNMKATNMQADTEGCGQHALQGNMQAVNVQADV